MKVCFTTYIYGDNYQDYIPLILYSVYKSYPEYSVILFVNGLVREDIKYSIESIRKYYGNFEIVENTFDDCPSMNSLKAQSLRWVLWHKRFEEFDYLYYIDSDILYIREPIPMHIQHMKHMDFIQSDCASNILRKKILSNTDFVSMYFAYKYGGWRTFIEYLKASSVYRMSGIHFVKVNTYFKYLNSNIRDKYKEGIYNGRAFIATKFADNEALLYNMMKEAGCNMKVFAIQNTSISMFGFNMQERKEFCPHHGIHLGLFRVAISEFQQWRKAQLDSADYSYYIEIFVKDYMNDPKFKAIKKIFSKKLILVFNRMYAYYKIKEK